MRKIRSALISVYHKKGLEPILSKLNKLGVTIYSTGGTYKYIIDQDIPVKKVEDLTGYPSILDGRVKTLHPKIFGGILARREEDHLNQLQKYEIPELDLVIVDLYPFEETVLSTNDESAIIEKIDIGGISLIRAAAKNYKDVAIVSSQSQYPDLLELLKAQAGDTSLQDRLNFAKAAFAESAHYDSKIYQYFNRDNSQDSLKISYKKREALRYGENPHQNASFYGNLEDIFSQKSGKALSYNNLVDIDAALHLMKDFREDQVSFAILKHTNPCGMATRPSVLKAWKAALAGDPISAFGGILACNTEIDLATAQEIDKIFYEVLIAPSFSADAFGFLSKKKKRVLLILKRYPEVSDQYKTLLDGMIHQEMDLNSENAADFKEVTKKPPTDQQKSDLVFANKCVKHLKSNTIVLVKEKQLIGMGCGQTSRVDAAKQAIDKAIRMGFDVKNSVMASDAFFPFPDCVEIADQAGIVSVVQPGGSIKDQLSIDYCNAHELSMVFTGTRHFKH
jgi:phosphoribosylaminoimidazolecarboxamide formyltransferase/IMP cyclohydrolase